jgi:hypothetical protein
MANDYDSMGRHRFESYIEQYAQESRRELPSIVRKEILIHLAMFQRVDSYKIDNLERISSIRDEHGAWFGSVIQSDIDEILNRAAGYTIDW